MGHAPEAWSLGSWTVPHFWWLPASQGPAWATHSPNLGALGLTWPAFLPSNHWHPRSWWEPWLGHGKDQSWAQCTWWWLRQLTSPQSRNTLASGQTSHPSPNLDTYHVLARRLQYLWGSPIPVGEGNWPMGRGRCWSCQGREPGSCSAPCMPAAKGTAP